MALEEGLATVTTAATAKAAEHAAAVVESTAQHEADASLCRELGEKLEAALATAAGSEEALLLARGLTDSANATRDEALAELDAARTDMKAMEFNLLAQSVLNQCFYPLMMSMVVIILIMIMMTMTMIIMMATIMIHDTHCELSATISRSLSVSI